MAILYAGQNRRNVARNGQFDLWQYGTSQTTNGMLSCNGWVNAITGSSTCTYSQQSFTLGQTDVPMQPRYYMRAVVSAGAGTSDKINTRFNVTNVQTFAGEICTLSFYAKASASLNFATEFAQHYGSGGSPSTVDTAVDVKTHALTTSWQPFTHTVSLPALTGKTIGTDINTSSLRIFMYYDAGSDYDARTNSLGHQSGTFDLANVQLEAGAEASIFDRRSVDENLRIEQAYFNKSYALDVDPGTASTTAGGIYEFGTRNNATYTPGIRFPCTMQKAPTVIIYSPITGTSGYADNNGTDRVAVAGDISSTGFSFVQLTSAGTTTVGYHYTAQAEIL